MAGGIMLFKINCNDLVLEGGRSFADAERPFYLAAQNWEWAMTLGEADRLAGAARRVEFRLRWARDHGTAAKAGPLFRRNLQFDSEIVEVELGISDDGKIYFEFGEERADLVEEQGLILINALGRFADEASTIFRASQPQYEDPTHGWPLLGLRQIWHRRD
jgi:hypothetical protein